MPDTKFNDFMKLYEDYNKEPFSFLVNSKFFAISENPLKVKKKLL